MKCRLSKHLKNTLVTIGLMVLCHGNTFGESDLQDISIILDDSQSGSFQARASFFVPASKDTVWKVLTDYELIKQYVPSIQSSEIVERSSTQTLVRQSGSLHWFMFHQDISVLLRIQELPSHQILFEDLSKCYFNSYVGTWTIEDKYHGSSVTYQITSVPKFFVPPFVAQGLFSDQVRTMLEQVRQKILS